LDGDGRIVVLGIGNVLMRDDGFGPYVVRQLGARYEVPDGVEIIDGGTPGLDFHPFFDGTRVLIVVDTVQLDAPVGEVRVYRRDQLLDMPLLPRTTPHQPGLGEALHAGRFAGEVPEEVVLVGVCAEDFSTGPGLSREIRAATEPAIEAVVEELSRAGAPPAPRSVPEPADIWWEEDPKAGGGNP
jgi:hydrogenase maturation protease